MNNKQLGFTLIELMISLALGLIVTAAAILLFLTGQKSIAMQKGVAQLQDNANFGLNYITRDLRLTNLNTKDAAINDGTLYGGVVLTSVASSFVGSTTDSTTGTVTKYPNLPSSIVGLADTFLTQGNGITTAVTTGNGWSGVSNVVDTSNAAFTSDQLVIQFLPQYTIDRKSTPTDESDDDYVGGTDCEGNELRFSKSSGLRVVVQRYFLREDTNKSSNESSPLALACDAGYYALGGAPTAITNYGGAGEVIVKRVDHFRVLLGTLNGADHRYVSIAAYMAMTPPRPRIQSIQLGMLVRSTQSVGGDSMVKANQTFQVLDQTVKAKTSTDPKYIRQVVSQTIALRNALGERE